MCGDAAADPVPPLVALGADAGAVSVSGVSSGGYMAVQMHVAQSAAIVGAGVLAGGPYFCAGGGFPFNLPRALGVCMTLGSYAPFAGPPDIAPLVEETRARAAAGDIDDPRGLDGDRVYLFSGRRDTFVPQAVMQSLRRYYETFLAAGNIAAVFDVDAAHAMIGIGPGAACDAFAKPFINDCDYDAAGALLAHIYGPLSPPVDGGGRLVAFDQRPFAGTPGDAGLADIGYVYVPERCAGADGCRLHVAFHGCLQNGETVGEAFVTRAGYNGWAEANAIIVLYPQTTSRGATVLGVALPGTNPAGCWDWFGYTGDGYHLKRGAQIAAVKAMIDRLTAPR